MHGLFVFLINNKLWLVQFCGSGDRPHTQGHLDLDSYYSDKYTSQTCRLNPAVLSSRAALRSSTPRASGAPTSSLSSSAIHPTPCRPPQAPPPSRPSAGSEMGRSPLATYHTPAWSQPNSRSLQKTGSSSAQSHVASRLPLSSHPQKNRKVLLGHLVPSLPSAVCME